MTKKEVDDSDTVAVANAEENNVSKVTPTPRGRPIITNGVTRRIRTGEGSLYITINEDQEGLCEVFTTIGKAGGNAAAQSEAISRLISLALRSGVNPTSVVRQLKGISGSKSDASTSLTKSGEKTHFPSSGAQRATGARDGAPTSYRNSGEFPTIIA